MRREEKERREEGGVKIEEEARCARNVIGGAEARGMWRKLSRSSQIKKLSEAC